MLGIFFKLHFYSKVEALNPVNSYQEIWLVWANINKKCWWKIRCIACSWWKVFQFPHESKSEKKSFEISLCCHGSKHIYIYMLGMLSKALNGSFNRSLNIKGMRVLQYLQTEPQSLHAQKKTRQQSD